MPFQAPITVRTAINSIERKHYLLPAIQREFVWSADQITRLFDSLMRDYPIGSFLYWQVDRHHIHDYQFYEILREYHERDRFHNPRGDVSGEEAITAILDGQQRLTALYIGLKGSYAAKLPWKWWRSDDAFPRKRLYLNLLSSAKNSDLLYDFRFLTDEDARKHDDDTYWFKVGDVLNFRDLSEVLEYLINKDLTRLEANKAKYANRTLANLFAAINEKFTINYYLEDDQDIEKVLNIFIRVNSGGTILSYSDLLLSIATAQWQERDAREVITTFVDELNNIGSGFSFNKDFVLKSCLVLNDLDVRFRVSNFNKTNMNKIEDKWDEVERSIKQAVILLASFGYNSENLPSNNAVIPIAYYLLRNDMNDNFIKSSNHLENRKIIQRWLIASLLKRTFSGTPDNVLRKIRNIIFTNPGNFPLEEIKKGFRGETKSIIFTEDDLDNLLTYRYGQSYTFSTLAILYPTLDFSNLFHIDHIFPKSIFSQKELKKLGIGDTSRIAEYIQKSDSLANLQLLEGLPNEEKSNRMFEEWLYSAYPSEEERKIYRNKHYIPDTEYNLDNFDKFIYEREKMLKEGFKKLIGDLVS